MIEFFFDCSSPWTYIAFRKIQPLAVDLQTSIEWRPVLVGGIFNSVNKGVYAAREDMNSAKNRYLLKDVRDSANHAGLQIKFPPDVFPVNSVRAMRGCVWVAQDAEARTRHIDFIEETFSAYFTANKDISQDEVLVQICRQVGIDPARFLAGIALADVKNSLKANTDEAIRRGAFGSPTFFVGDDMFFGSDRLELVSSAVERAGSASATEHPKRQS